MNGLNYRVAVVLIALWALALLICGIVSGIGMLAFVGVSVLLCRWYWQSVVRRPVPALAVRLVQFGEQRYWMEVA